jgi:curved DNA-binding protein CbpA
LSVLYNMGQTQSQTKDVSQMYASYIQQQQNLIFQQQQQINSLYHHSNQPQQQQQQYQQPQPQPQPQPQQYQQQLPRLAAPIKHKLDPYKILGLPKVYDKKMLKRAYLKTAMKAHPDRGGSPQLFQQVSIAYTLLTKKLKEQENSHSHEDMQSGAKDYIQTQESQPKVNINMKDNFDGQLFNQIYEENKINDAYDKGYGSWMEKNPASGPGPGLESGSALESGSGPEQTKLFQSGFNQDMFNATFDKFKQETAQQYKQQLTKYEDPEERLSMKNQDSLVTLGQGEVSDFSGSSDNLQYTDYKKAYTYGSNLIDASSVSLDGRSQSIDGVKSQRSNLSYELSPEDQKRLALQQVREQKEEDKRVQRLNVYDQKHGQAYERIHGLLLR